MLLTAQKADLLIQALPYIQKYNNKTIVVKYGGNAMQSEELKNAVLKNVVLLSLVGINVVLVHGGGPEITELLTRTGKESHFVNGLRYTDDDTMEIVQMVLAGKINKGLVSMIENLGGRAVGLCGLDGGMIRARRMSGAVDYGRVGEITSINPSAIRDSIASGYIPVVATVAGSEDDSGSYNINADTAAAMIASSLGAIKLMLLTDTPGVLRDCADPESLIPIIARGEIAALTESGIISGGMIPKIDCCLTAIDNGVQRAHIIDGRIANSLLIELLSDEGIGTMIE